MLLFSLPYLLWELGHVWSKHQENNKEGEAKNTAVLFSTNNCNSGMQRHQQSVLLSPSNEPIDAIHFKKNWSLLQPCFKNHHLDEIHSQVIWHSLTRNHNPWLWYYFPDQALITLSKNQLVFDESKPNLYNIQHHTMHPSLNLRAVLLHPNNHHSWHPHNFLCRQKTRDFPCSFGLFILHYHWVNNYRNSTN